MTKAETLLDVLKKNGHDLQADYVDGEFHYAVVDDITAKAQDFRPIAKGSGETIGVGRTPVEAMQDAYGDD